MAKYTFELRELFEPIKFNPPLYTRSEVEGFFKDYELEDYLTQEQIDTILKANVWSKEKLARKIVDHYYMRESGLETIGLFKHYAKVKMQELMEYYLPLIYSNSINYDPLVNVDYTETFNKSTDNTAESTSSQSLSTTTSNTTSTTGNNSGLEVNSDTPQGQITKANILAGNYASSTSATENESENETEFEGEESTSNEGSVNTEGNTTEEYTKRIKGNSGVSATSQKMILQYRENIRNIDYEIIKDLNSLFMGLY